MSEWWAAESRGGEKLTYVLVQCPQSLEVSSMTRELIQEEAEAGVCPFKMWRQSPHQHIPGILEGHSSIGTWGPPLGSDMSPLATASSQSHQGRQNNRTVIPRIRCTSESPGKLLTPGPLGLCSSSAKM